MAAPISGPGGSTAPPAAAAVPAQLGFLAIYNPSLGTTDETMEDQIVYYSSVVSPSSSSSSRKQGRGSITDPSTREDRNERLRQIGLAQGMVEFGRSFSGDRPVDTVETEKSRVVLHELEPGWWILASVDLTRLPVAAAATKDKAAGKEGGAAAAASFEYSTREVKPAALLLQDLLRAHSVFLLHHDSSLSALFVRTNRQRFTSVVSRFWDVFLASWNVMLHGNPLRNVFGGIKVAACGELGFGVGEEERGSGEREVLEGLVGRIDGLVDLVVGKFGEADEIADGKLKTGREVPEQWLGTGSDPGAEDGAIFLGVGALSRHSLRDVTFWMEDLYTWGENAYGVKESPTARKPHPRRKKAASKSAVSTPPAAAATPKAPAVEAQSPDSSGPTGFQPPPPIVKPAAAQAVAKQTGPQNASGTAQADKDNGGLDKMMGYLKLGYGTYWSLGSTPPPEEAASGPPTTAVEPSAARPPLSSRSTSQDDAAGHYLIGLMGDIEETGAGTDEPPDEAGHNSRILLRTVTVELESEGTDKPECQISHDLGSNDTELAPQQPKPTKSLASSSRTVKNNNNNSSQDKNKTSESSPSKDDGSSQTSRGDNDEPRDGAQNQQTTFDSQDRNKTRKVRVVVYVNKPFVFVFLFNLHNDSLNWDATYRSLHHELAPLRRSLLASTSYRPDRPAAADGGGGQKIYDLVWDPRSLTVHSTIPNIPVGREGEQVWSRVEALNTHVQLLNTHASTRGGGREMELERTAKTSRGWWIVWSRVLEREAGRGGSAGSVGEGDEQGEGEGEGGRSQGDGASGRSGGSGSTDGEITLVQDGAVVGKEIFLIRKAGDHAGGVRSYVSVGSGGGGGWADGASRLAQGIGVDTRKYIEGLLSLNR
ncbi:hypothetical protein BR93DRAFT_964838 [Coniochaeta sp. PMI_546]|nr:hypothetical protein BR93DRAFT_964838 [Coniochaeta sp. PMI_546]